MLTPGGLGFSAGNRSSGFSVAFCFVKIPSPSVCISREVTSSSRPQRLGLVDQASNGGALSDAQRDLRIGGLISFDEDLLMLLSGQLRDYLPHDAVKLSFESHQGNELLLPSDATPPEPSFLARHRACFGFP